MSEAVQIDKGIPLPAFSAGRKGRNGEQFPWKGMAVGDSFFAPGYVMHPKYRTANEPVLTASHGRPRIPGSMWAARSVTENGVAGVRVWRTA